MTIADLTKILALVDKTYSQIPEDVILHAERIANSMFDIGSRRIPHIGTGIDFFEARKWQQGDDIRRINAKLSARLGHNMIIQRQHEVMQPVFIWRKGHGSVNIRYDQNRLTKKEYMDAAFLAFAKSLAVSNDKVGILEGEGIYSGHSAMERVSAELLNVNILTGNMPIPGQKIPENSHVFLGSDFFMNPEDQSEIMSAVRMLAAMGVQGHMCMVLDPEEIDFQKFKGNIKFKEVQGHKSYHSKKAESLRVQYNRKMMEYIDLVQGVAHQFGFKFMLQTVDQDPLDLVLKLYGHNPNASAPSNGLTL
jgi:hypothetical protein